MAYMTSLPRIDAYSGEVSILCVSGDRSIMTPAMAIRLAATLLDAAAQAEGHALIQQRQAGRRLG